jgi:hypothetical protein
LGLPGSTIQSASVENVSLNFTRAYTGIAFGMGATQNVVIDRFTIVDHEMSAITALGGNHIQITNGSITGGAEKNVDDGIALYAVYGPLSGVVVRNIQSQDNFDLVGIGALMYYPITGIQVSDSQCTRTAVCLYIKAGNPAPVPAGFPGYSQLSQLTISNITDSDPTGARYLSSIWITGAGGAAASGIAIDHVTANAWPAAPLTARIKLFTDPTSTLSNVTLSHLTFLSPAPKPSAASRAAEGINFQDQGSQNISGVNLTGVSIDGADYFAIDSSSAVVNNLTLDTSSFTHMNLANPGGPMFLIPYSYRFDGSMVAQ